MDTLALNADYSPMAFINWQRAMTLLCEGKVTILETYPNRTVRTAKETYSVPSVVLFKKFTRKRKRVIKYSPKNVWLRDRGICQYCGKFVSFEKFTRDHVIPQWMGGKTCFENIVCSCYECNQRKAGKTVEEAGMPLIRQPVHPHDLPNNPVQLVQWNPGMPPSWANWLMRTVPVEERN